MRELGHQIALLKPSLKVAVSRVEVVGDKELTFGRQTDKGRRRCETRFDPGQCHQPAAAAPRRGAAAHVAASVLRNARRERPPGVFRGCHV